MKIFLNLLLIFLVFELQSGVFCNKNWVRTNFEIGRRVKGDKNVQTTTLLEKPGSRVLGIFKSKVEAKLVLDLNRELKDSITNIVLLEQEEQEFKAGPATKVEVLKGGIGEKDVTLKVTGVKGIGLSYRVFVYGV